MMAERALRNPYADYDKSLATNYFDGAGRVSGVGRGGTGPTRLRPTPGRPLCCSGPGRKGPATGPGRRAKQPGASLVLRYPSVYSRHLSG